MPIHHAAALAAGRQARTRVRRPDHRVLAGHPRPASGSRGDRRPAPDIPSPVLEALPGSERARLIESGRRRRLLRGERLFIVGDRGRGSHVVLAGVLLLTARTAGGEETTLGMVVPGEVAGDVALLDDLPQPFDAVAASRVEVLSLPTPALLTALERHPRAALELGRQLAARARWVSETALERTHLEVPARLAGRLLDLADRIGRLEAGAVELEVELPQQELARLAGMCRESACKALGTFRRRGWVAYRGGRLRILRPDALERVRCGGRLR